MEILRMSAQKKIPACVDLRTKCPNTPQTSSGKCPQFSMRNITFYADISGTGTIIESLDKDDKAKVKQSAVKRFSSLEVEHV